MSKSARHWSKVGQTGTLFGMKFLLLVYRLFGRAGFRCFLYPVMVYYYFSRREARESSQQYLQRLSPFLTPQQRVPLSSFKHFFAFGEMMLDKFLVWMGRLGKDDVVFETPEVFEQLRENKSGGVIIVSHLGNMEVCKALSHQFPGICMTVLVHSEHAEKFNSLIKKADTGGNVKALEVADMSPATAMILQERIEAGEYIVTSGDRTPLRGQERTSTVQFLGAGAPMPQGAFILAGLLRCPVYLLFCIKQQAHYHLYAEHLLDRLKFSRKDRQQAISDGLQQYAERLQHYCTIAPLQWFNFFPFWDDVSESKETDSTLSTAGDNGN